MAKESIPLINMAPHEAVCGEGSIVDEFDPAMMILRRTIRRTDVDGLPTAKAVLSLGPDWEQLAEAFPEYAVYDTEFEDYGGRTLPARHDLTANERTGLTKVVLQGGIDFYQPEEQVELLTQAAPVRHNLAGVRFAGRFATFWAARARWQEIVAIRDPGQGSWDEEALRSLMDVWTNMQHALSPHSETED